MRAGLSVERQKSMPVEYDGLRVDLAGYRGNEGRPKPRTHSRSSIAELLETVNDRPRSTHQFSR